MSKYEKVWDKAMRSGNIFEIRCIFGKIGPETRKFLNGISSVFLFRTLVPTGVPFQNIKNGPKIFAKIDLWKCPKVLL